MENFESAFKSWLEGSQNIITEYAKKQSNGEKRVEDIYNNKLVVKKGKKYIKVISEACFGSSKCVWAFIDTTNGNVLKPASYKAPAKHARGNLFDEFNGLGSITPYGPSYMRGY
jgi:hypothetical protein